MFDGNDWRDLKLFESHSHHLSDAAITGGSIFCHPQSPVTFFPNRPKFVKETQGDHFWDLLLYTGMLQYSHCKTKKRRAQGLTDFWVGTFWGKPSDSQLIFASKQEWCIVYVYPPWNESSEFTPKNGWIRGRFLLGFGLFSGANFLLVLGRVNLMSSGVGPSILSLLSDRCIWSPQLHWIFFIANSKKLPWTAKISPDFFNALSFWLGAMMTEFSRMRQISNEMSTRQAAADAAEVFFGWESWWWNSSGENGDLQIAPPITECNGWQINVCFVFYWQYWCRGRLRVILVGVPGRPTCLTSRISLIT